jgi:1,2-phenylacetyl-CoA epoxidase PaaB subunit
VVDDHGHAPVLEEAGNADASLGGARETYNRRQSACEIPSFNNGIAWKFR